MLPKKTEKLSGKIFLSEFKGSSLFGANEDSFGDLYAFDDERISAAATKTYKAEAGTYIIIMPVTGDLLFQKSGRSESLEVAVGQILICRSTSFFNFEVTNSFPQDEINFLQFRLQDNLCASGPVLQVLNFELFELKNKLIEISPLIEQCKFSFPFRISIGQFGGREEAVYTLQGVQKRFFCFVLAGAFEIEGRLLHARDGLALWNTREVELEALSNNAVVLTLEIN